MGWSVSCYRSAKEPVLLDEFFLALGKSLYLANAFESKCRFLLRITKLARHFTETNDASASIELANAFKEPMLGQTIQQLAGLFRIQPNDIALLEGAKDARNFIAHEGGNLGHAWTASANDIQDQFERLRREVADLIGGDNVVSRWLYEIEERSPHLERSKRRTQVGSNSGSSEEPTPNRSVNADAPQAALAPHRLRSLLGIIENDHKRTHPQRNQTHGVWRMSLGAAALRARDRNQGVRLVGAILDALE